MAAVDDYDNERLQAIYRRTDRAEFGTQEIVCFFVDMNEIAKYSRGICAAAFTADLIRIPNKNNE
jgi:hypothetical protein